MNEDAKLLFFKIHFCGLSTGDWSTIFFYLFLFMTFSALVGWVQLLFKKYRREMEDYEFFSGSHNNFVYLNLPLRELFQ
jgi:hypothetical protein